ncbi:MAG TPA: GntR family transcriptional regulator [Trebonia sp.]|nr:GntR family transcriptional regulator [Trebonia sp.]
MSPRAALNRGPGDEVTAVTGVPATTAAAIRSGTPDEERIRRALLRRVRAATAQDRRLPGEFDLAAELGCSRVQVRQALGDLDRSGLIRRRQGAATVVDPVGLRLNVRLEEQFDYADLLARLGYEVGVEILESCRITVLTSHVAGLLDVPARTPAVRVRRRWTADGAPAMVAEDILLLPPGEDQVPEEPLFRAAVTLWGEPVVWEITTPSAAAADGDLATLLGLPEQSPLMVFETVGMLAGGRRIFYALEHHKSDLVQYSVVRTVRPPWHTT